MGSNAKHQWKVVGSCNKHAKENVTGKIEFALFEKRYETEKDIFTKRKPTWQKLRKNRRRILSLIYHNRTKFSEKMDEDFSHLISIVNIVDFLCIL